MIGYFKVNESKLLEAKRALASPPVPMPMNIGVCAFIYCVNNFLFKNSNIIASLPTFELIKSHERVIPYL